MRQMVMAFVMGLTLTPCSAGEITPQMLLVAMRCTGCHHPGNDEYPAIWELPPGDMAAELRAFQDGSLRGAVMSEVASTVDPAMVDDLAAYLSDYE